MFSVASMGGLAGAGEGTPIVGGDPNFNSVVLLTHMEAAPPIDESDSSHTLAVGAGGSIVTAQKKFGTQSLDCVNSTTGYVEAADHADWLFGAGQFTVECFARWSTVPGASENQGLVGQWLPTGNQRSWLLAPGQDVIQWFYSGNGTEGLVYSAAWTISADTWYHVAVDRNSSGQLKVYIDGVVFIDEDNSGTTYHNSTGKMRVGIREGGAAAQAMDGWIDEVRITNGVARYDGAFTPPPAPFPDSL